MAVTPPGGTLETRLSRYLDGFKGRHGIEDSAVEGNLVQVVVKPDDLPAVLTTAREALGILHLSFITVVDRQGSFELTYELLDLRGAQVRVKTTIEGDEPVIGSVTGIYPTANWHEREAYDMFGVAFRGHPDLRRLYMWQDHFDHHPLLKSFEISMLSEEHRTEGTALTEPASGRLVNPDVRDEFGLETIDMNMGPQHPAMHGLLRLILELDGETVVRCDPVMGYLHRSKEKIAENRMYPAVIPMTDRLDYFANMHHEHGYVLAVEDLLDVEIPPRAEYIRVLMCELMRLASHIPSIGFLMLELGAFTPIMYAFRERERIQSIFEAVTGARMMF